MMPIPASLIQTHPLGESPACASQGQNDTFVVETPGGVFHVTYDTEAKVGHLGGVVPFAQFLHASGLFSNWIADTPLSYASNRALTACDVLGTLALSMVNGHYRFAHISGLRGDAVTPQVLGMKQVASEDAVRRAMLRLVKEEEDRTATMSWLRRHMQQTLDPLLKMPWVLDIDVTVKPVYGYQPGSVVGYNPHKPGRPSHALHSFVMAQTRLVLDVAVHPGNEHASNHTLPTLQRLLNDMPRDRWPQLLRGDCGFGTDDMMSWAESVGLRYLFKQRMTKHTKNLILELDFQNGWIPFGQGWECKESVLQLSTWNHARRVIVLRRPDPGPRYPRAKDIAQQQPQQGVIDACVPYIVAGTYEYQVLVTNLSEPIATIVQYYRDRADVENVFDEIKNHWGWGGFTSRTFEVTQAVAVIGALIYNWWSIFCRLASPEHHREAVTTRPTLLHGVLRQTSHSNQRHLTVTSTNRNKVAIAQFFIKVGQWISGVVANAEQWTSAQRWEAMVKIIFSGVTGTAAPSTA